MAAMVRAAGAGCAAAAAESPIELAQRLGAERAAAVQGLTAEQAARRAAEDRAAAAESRTSEVAEVRAVMCQGVAEGLCTPWQAMRYSQYIQDMSCQKSGKAYVVVCVAR